MSVESMQYTGYNFDSVEDFTHGRALLFNDEKMLDDGTVFSGSTIGLKTSSGFINVRIGDYILKKDQDNFLIIK